MLEEVPMGGWAPAVVPPAVAAALYVLALRRTAGVAAAGVAVVTVAVAVTALALGERPGPVAGATLLTAGCAAVAWALGRSGRRRRARRLALEAYRAAAGAAAEAAGEVERHRLAAELHDTAAHRFTGIVVGAASALRLADPDLQARAVRDAAETARLAEGELERLTGVRAPGGGAQDERPGPRDLADLDALVAAWPDPRVTYVRTARSAPPEIAAVAYRVVREALTNALRYAEGGTVRVAVEQAADRLVITLVDGPTTTQDAAQPSDDSTSRHSGTTPVPGPDETAATSRDARTPPLPSAVGRSPGLAGAGTAAGLGGRRDVEGLGGGHGLAGLRVAVAECGGVLSAGPEGAGWAVRAEFPLQDAPSAPVPSASAPSVSVPSALAPSVPALSASAASPPGPAAVVPAALPLSVSAPPVSAPPVPGRWGGWRGGPASNGALVLFAVAWSVGFSLLADDVPLSAGEVALLAVLFVAHALPLAVRARAPLPGLAAALSVHPVLLAAWFAGWTTQPAGDFFLWCLWVELTLLYAVGVQGGRRWRPGAAATATVAAAGGLVLACGPGIVGDRAAAGAVLASGLAVPAAAAWALGVGVARLRARRRTATRDEQVRLSREAEAAVRAERARLEARLRSSALRRMGAVLAAAERGRLDVVLAEARAGLAALRESLDELRSPVVGDDPPPTFAGIALLATRHQAAVRYAGGRREASPGVEVAAFTAVELMLRGRTGAEITVTGDGAGTAVRGPASPRAVRRLRALADAAGGGFTAHEDGTVTVWLPET
ncbi:sensor histidine kinase [Nonomuraea pusilla]|uniref:histidine kinase n=1 Tax=Nonomuraea pusilla TaxID=46177 RepID=A0A1H7IK96_9ACTN|nr:histidine kinase [Nonomuraea pusilla]SEK62744.1 Signal transduction histidine kinase [Nonomuraea pusilla]